MRTTFINGVANYLDSFGNFHSSVEDARDSILDQLESLIDGKCPPFVEAVEYAPHFEEIHCFIKYENFDMLYTARALRTLVTSCGYYNAFLGKSLEEFIIKVMIIDPVTKSVYQTLIYPETK